MLRSKGIVLFAGFETVTFAGKGVKSTVGIILGII
jgi:hypothetical protein